MTKKRVSCGVLLFNEKRELFVAHVTGQDWWDIPKGLLDEGEAPLYAALREAREEAGLVLQEDALHDLGLQPYLPNKDLYLFTTIWPYATLDLVFCRCSSFFECKKTGLERPEVDAYQWIPIDSIPDYGGKYLTKLLFEVLDVRALAEAVVQSKMADAPGLIVRD